MEVVGKIHAIGALEIISEKFQKREVIVEVADNPTYPEYVKFELQGDKVHLAEQIAEGQEVTVSFNLRGRPWTNREGVTNYFNTLVIWRID